MASLAVAGVRKRMRDFRTGKRGTAEQLVSGAAHSVTFDVAVTSGALIVSARRTQRAEDNPSGLQRRTSTSVAFVLQLPNNIHHIHSP